MGYGNIIIIALLGFMASLILTSMLIPILKHKQAGQNIREEGPSSHLSKAGTPSMGGIAIILGAVVATMIGGFLSINTGLIMIGFLGFGAIGFFDDYLKVVKKVNTGLLAWQKFGLQAILAVGLTVYIGAFSPIGTGIFVPFYNQIVDFGIWFYPFLIFAILAIVNAVNLTDGLDGLAAGNVAIVSLFLAFLGLKIGSDSAGIFFSALLGACLGFLVYNKYPAKVFMGDTGSLALGGALIVGASVMQYALILPIVGFVFVLETLSVCIQVISFKLTGKRVFKMAPIHHHFELSGMKEQMVVLLFWVISLVCCLIGLFII